MSNLNKHAILEFQAAGWLTDDGYNDDMQEAICKHVLKLIDIFADEGHSGTTAPYAISLFSRLARFEPIAPLTGEDWEWNDTGHNYQNKRASHVFKDYDGSCYDIDGKVFWEWYKDGNGEAVKTYYSGSGCSVPVTFPYTPPDKPIYEYRWSDAEPRTPPQTEEGFIVSDVTRQS